MNKKTATLLFAFSMPVVAMAQSVNAPELKEDESWTYTNTLETGQNGWHQTHNVITLERITASHLYISEKQAGSTAAANELITDVDWSRARAIAGNDVVVNRPFAFPLTTGKTWEVTYTEPHPSENPKFSSATWTTRYKVVGYEDIQVPAGKFHALKIEAEGNWRGEVASGHSIIQTAQVQPGQTTLISQARNVTPQTASGDLYKAFWYAPEVGRWVKSVEEYYGSNGVRSQRFTTELESYKASGA